MARSYYVKGRRLHLDSQPSTFNSQPIAPTLHAEFWSSVEYSTFGRALAAELTQRGLATEHRFERTQREYWAARGRITRWRLRAAAYGIYPLRLLGHFVRAEPGLVGVVCTNTFYAPTVALAASPRSTPIVHWVLDLFPDVLTVAGKLRRGGLGDRALRSMVRWTFQRAAANVFLGEHLRRYAEVQFGEVPRSVVIPVGADGAPFRGTPPQPSTGPARILYSGNLGRMHDIDTVAAVLRNRPLSPSGAQFHFRGNGAGFRELQTKIGGLGAKPRDGVVFGDNLPEAQWREAMLAADIALVTMKRGAEGLVMPSKTYSALVAGQAILAICPSQSDLADTVRRHQCGWVVEPGDTGGLSRALDEIEANPAAVLEKRRSAYAAGHSTYDQPVIAAQWERLLRTVAAEVGPAF